MFHKLKSVVVFLKIIFNYFCICAIKTFWNNNFITTTTRTTIVDQGSINNEHETNVKKTAEKGDFHDFPMFRFKDLACIQPASVYSTPKTGAPSDCFL